MQWKDRIDQLAALLEKIPQPQSFELERGIYQPYFLLDLRPANWEIAAYAEYTRLDGEAGKEVKLSFQVIENQKVNISQEELNVLAYIYSFANYDTRRLFSYGQPVGFLLDWLRGSRLKIRKADKREIEVLDFFEETGNLSLGIFKREDVYILQPAIVFPEHSIILHDSVDILTANPIFLNYQNRLYHVVSNMPPFFWINFFRIQQEVEIPVEELREFINLFVPKILPALDWKGLQEHLKLYELPLTSVNIYLYERAGQLVIEVKSQYQEIEFPIQPLSNRSLASRGEYLFVVKRDQGREKEICKLLQENGLFYIQHRWQIDPQYRTLDWIRLKLPLLSEAGIKIFGEEKLSRYRLRKGTPRLRTKVTSGLDWFDLDFQLELNSEVLKIPELREQIQQKKRYFKLSDGSNVYLKENLLRRLQEFYSLLDIYKTKGSQKIHSTALPLLEELCKVADDFETDSTYDKIAKSYHSFRNIQRVNPSASFSGTLRDYQQAGLDWLHFLNPLHFGGILADDMGLGKTVQVIALLQNLKDDGRLKNPVLIIVPLTVLFNWERELLRFAPQIRVLRYQGQKNERERMLKQIHHFDVVVMSYGILLQDNEFLQKLSWDYIILDESQKIKNPTTKTYQAVSSFQVPHRLCLTGTPVENSIIDLWAQFNFLNPGMLGTIQQFEARFIKNGNDEKDRQDLLKRIIYPFILRRKKEDVIKELPERTDIIQFMEMTDIQKEIYATSLNHFRAQIFNQIEKDGLPQTKIKVLEALTYLRQLACHPAILDQSVNLDESGKMLLLADMLEEILEEGHKVLVFSQFVRFLSLVRQLLDSRSWPYEYLDGSTRKRENHIRNFQENEEVKIFLISLKAGGLGLNLTAADYVIHLDPWWNPAVEQQATDRAHRIGQENRVFVYKYIMKNSVEEKILALQQDKKDLSDNLISSEDGFFKQLTREDLQIIFKPIE